ncbi:MAG TPA: antibiotic biosynthesis monooxygenase, partial [Verrucomicrobiales bacterium]|nr:antibiotic biosynthesis monooxygenase [Verrucomicrobiales bacterium]
LHQDNQNPALFLFFENWESRKLWQDHMNNTHLAEYASATEGSINSIVIQEMSRV